jgi:hypothetical protein
VALVMVALVMVALVLIMHGNLHFIYHLVF